MALAALIISIVAAGLSLLSILLSLGAASAASQKSKTL